MEPMGTHGFHGYPLRQTKYMPKSLVCLCVSLYVCVMNLNTGSAVVHGYLNYPLAILQRYLPMLSPLK